MRRALAALLLTLLAVVPARADPDALWYIVNEQCVPDQQQFRSPKPCTLVDLGAGYVVLKDRVGVAQYLVMPTARISGIESPEILAADSPNYWEAAWQARRYVADALNRSSMPRETISLAINSIHGRTQNQLHIHVDCTRPEVIAALRSHAGNLGPAWTKFPVKLSGHDYMAMRIERADLAGSNPFLLLADGIPNARADMGPYTLVIAGMPEGFVLLAGRASGITNRGSGEELQDHACAIAR
ncbi:MAG: CDP-diacylglycerol diphosphatase [Acetobacteraceae bacterium]